MEYPAVSVTSSHSYKQSEFWVMCNNSKIHYIHAVLFTSVIYYLKTSEKGDVSILIWHMIKVKQKVGQRQNRCCCIRWTAISESDRETWSIPKNKAQSDCAPDGTTYELRNVLIYVAHDTHAINKTSGEMEEYVYSLMRTEITANHY